ncbi:hypothetical protein MRB53_032871 [Persea americana]|uniref:Uncharacterized protein n=1 Tax=Persea americana TaxID=3435 RepID=A0ACC2KSY1_PERAE|nr:hypothetical protein MRB53_032871 [Persea americana]
MVYHPDLSLLWQVLAVFLMFLVQVCIFLLKWNSSLGCFDLFDEREFECRPPRLGLGAKLPRSKAAASADLVEKKLCAKLDAGKKWAAKDLEELNASDKNGEHSGDDEDGEEERVLYVCCEESEERFGELCGDRGMKIVVEIVRTASAAGAVRSVFGPFAELVKSWNLPDWLIHWGRPGNMVSSASRI